jgi:transmembrane sensor
MSDATNASPQRAKDMRTTAAAWLERRQRGNWSDADQAEFDAWLAMSMHHRTAYWRVADAWNRADRLRVLGTPMRTTAVPAKKAAPWILRAAAAAVVVAVAGGAAYTNYFSAPAHKSYSTTVGGRETLAFADGSEIDLNTDTVVRTAVTREKRMVWLDKGEAYFRIKHDAAHPFVVIAGGHRVTDLGTEFIVRREEGRLEVSLVEGRAQVDAANGSVRPKTLIPGDVLVATANTMAVTKKAQETLNDKLGWRQGVIVFRHTTLADAAAEFNRYSNAHLAIDGDAVARLTVVGTFRANDMKSFVEVAQTIFGLKVEKRDNEIVLSR